MRMPVPESLFALLKSSAVARGNDDSSELGEEAVWLHTDLGPSYYLTRDGRVLVLDAFEPTVGSRLAPESEAWGAIILGAENLDAPALLELLPKRTTGASDCAKCRGTGWWRLPGVWKTIGGPKRTSTEGTHQIICGDCGGLGWTA